MDSLNIETSGIQKRNEDIMKIAILIQCHKNPKQINLLLERLNHPDIDCYLHIDKKADFTDKIIHRENVFVLPDEQRVSVEWAQISQVTATLNLLNTAVAGIRGGYDYYWLISGQDWPLRSVEEIVEFFMQHNGENFIQYWSSKNLSKETVNWINNYLAENPDFYDFYRSSSTPDESFFHTLVMLSPFGDKTTDNLLYQHFQKGANSPDVLTADDLQRAKESKYLIMRKVDMDVDEAFLSI